MGQRQAGLRRGVLKKLIEEEQEQGSWQERVFRKAVQNAPQAADAETSPAEPEEEDASPSA